MKVRYLLFLFPFLSLNIFAQFEGTIKWGIKMEITDPKLKAQMAQANKQLSDPANQAKMKELEDKMNDPQFKSFMDQNPEMKAMIQTQIAAMKNGGGGNLIDNMMPKNVEIKVKNGNSLSKVEGGAFESETLYLKEKQASYSLDRKNKTYTVHTDIAEKNAVSEYKVTKTEEFKSVLNFKCRKHIVEGADQKQKATYSVWATTDIKDLDNKQFSKMRVAKENNANFLEKIDGIALMMEAHMPQGKMTMEVTDLKKEPVEATLFQIPVGFTQKK